MFDSLSVSLDSNPDLDVIYRVDGGLLVCLNPVSSGTSFFVDKPANDLALLEQPNQPPRVILAEPSGLSLLEFTIGNNPTVASWTDQKSVLASVLDLQRIVFVDRAQPEQPRILGIQAGGQALTSVVIDPASSPVLNPDPTFSSPVLQGAWDLEVADFDHDSNPEIAVLGTDGLKILGLDGSLINEYLHTSTEGSLVRFSNAMGDQVAWLRPSGFQTDLLLVSSTGISTPVTLSGHLVSGSSGDLDFDGDEELILGLRDPTKMLMLLNENGVFLPGRGAIIDTERVGGAINSLAQPLVADLDGDGTLDVAQANRNEQGISVFYNKDAGTYQGLLPPINYVDLANPQAVVWNFDAYGHDPKPSDVTDLQVRVYSQQASAQTGWNPPDPATLDPFYVHTVAAEPFEVSEQVAPRTITFPLAPTGVDPASVVTFVEGRFVVRNNGEILKQYPPVIFLLVDSNNAPAMGYLTTVYSGGLLLGDRVIGNGDRVGVGEIPPPPKPPTPPGP